MKWRVWIWLRILCPLREDIYKVQNKIEMSQMWRQIEALLALLCPVLVRVYWLGSLRYRWGIGDVGFMTSALQEIHRAVWACRFSNTATLANRHLSYWKNVAPLWCWADTTTTRLEQGPLIASSFIMSWLRAGAVKSSFWHWRGSSWSQVAAFCSCI